MEVLVRLSPTTSNTSELQIGKAVLGLLGMFGAMAIGAVSEIRPLEPNSPEYGYDEALGTLVSSPLSANFLSNCYGDAGIAATSNDCSDRFAVRAVVAQARPSTANLRAQASCRDMERRIESSFIC